jgi:hypothetical protein
MNLGKFFRTNRAQPIFAEVERSKNSIKIKEKRSGNKLKILVTSALCVLAIAIIVSAATIGFSLALRQRQSTKKSLNEKCIETSDCDTSRGLRCNNAFCSCLNDFEFRGDSCALKRLGRTCTDFSSCEIGYNLVCIDSSCKYIHLQL